MQTHRWFKNGDHPDDYAEDVMGFENDVLRTFSGAARKARGWEGGVVRYFRAPGVPGERICLHCNVRMHEHGWIDDGDSGKVVCPGDLIVTAADGKYHAVKPEAYAALMGAPVEL